MAQTINMFRAGEVQILVTTDACSEGIDVPECNLVVSMDKIKTSRSLIHTRGRARSKGGKFVIMVEDGDDMERDRVSLMLMESEDIKRFQLGHEKASVRVPLRHSHPNMVHHIESSGAVVDMDMATPLMNQALSAVGCDFHPLLIAEEKSGPSMMYREPSFKCRLELPSFMGMPTIDTAVLVDEHFWSKSQVRAAVSFLAVVQMLEKGYIDERLNPTRTKDRLVVEKRRGYDPVLVEGKEARIKAKMPIPRPVAMGILPTPGVEFDAAWMAAWRAADGNGASNGGSDSTNGTLGEAKSPEADAPSETAATAGSPPSPGAVGDGSEGGGDVQAGGPSGPGIGPAAAGAGFAVWEGARTRGCYDNDPGPKRRMRVYCFRSPAGEAEGWVPTLKRVRRRRSELDGSEEILEEEEDEVQGEDRAAPQEGEEGEDEDEEVLIEEEEHEADMRSFHPKLKVDLGRGPGKGLGPRLFVGLASAAPLPLTASQAAKVGIVDSFDVDLNPAQMAAIVQWHKETVGMAALYEIPHQMTQTPLNDPAKSPFQETGVEGDKGVLAVPVDYGDDGPAGDGVVKIDWPAIEAANAGVHLPDKTDEQYTRRILFSRVSHKTCRFYFILERTTTTLEIYLRRCLESDQGPYAGLPCETITPHDAGRMGRVKGVLAVGHGVRKPDYDAADKSQRLLLGVPAPALKHSFAQHLVRGERVMDPDAGVRSRVKVKRSSEKSLEDDGQVDGAMGVTEKGEENPEEAGDAPLAAADAAGTEQQGGDAEDREEEEDNDDGDTVSMQESDDDGKDDAMVVEAPVERPAASAESAAGELAVEAAVVTAGAAATLQAQRVENGGEEEDEARGWAGVSTLKLNNHKVGPGQPVLLVEQYCQPVCCTRRVFISVLHIVPRMFDLERQLLCFVLHESLFLPALQTSLYHRTPPGADKSSNDKLLLGPAAEEEEVGCNSPEPASSGLAVSAQGLAASDAAHAPSQSSQLLRLSPSGAAQEAAATVAPPTTASGSTGGKERGGGPEKEQDGEEETSSAAAAGGTGTDSAAESAEARGLLSVPEQDEASADAWPACGTWCTPGEGAGTGSGPGGSGCNADAPEEPSALGAPSGIMSAPGNGLGPVSGDSATGGGKGAGKIGVEAAAEGGAQAAARAAAVGVIKWNGGEEGAVTDTMALLDCSLRRPVNERLETLGDAWLNYYAGFVVFQDKPVLMEEGMMTLLRKNVVSNARLLKCADGRGLREFMYPPRSILGRPFDMWSPSLLPLPPPVKASKKTIADVVEALLGAALVAGGNRSAAYIMEWLGLPTLESSNDPEKAKEYAAEAAAAAAAAAEKAAAKAAANTAATAAANAAAAAAAAALQEEGGESKGNDLGESTGASETAAAVDSQQQAGGREGAGNGPAPQEEGVSTTTAASPAPAPAASTPAVDATVLSPPIQEMAAEAATAAPEVAAVLLQAQPDLAQTKVSGGGHLSSSAGDTGGSSGNDASCSRAAPVSAQWDDPMDEEETDGRPVSQVVRAAASGSESGPSPKRRNSSSEEDVLMPSSKRIRTPEGHSPAGSTGSGEAAAVAAAAAGRELAEAEKMELCAAVAEEGDDDDDEGPDSGDEGGGAVTDAAAAAGAARAAARAAAAVAAADEDPAAHPLPEAAAGAAVEGADGEGTDGEGEDGGRKKSLPHRAQLRDHIPEVDDRRRPWLWNPPEYLWGDPEKFGGWDGGDDGGDGDGGGRSRRPGRLSTPRRGRVGLHARGGGAAGASSSSGAMRSRGGRGGSGRGRSGSRGRGGSGERSGSGERNGGGGGDGPAATEIATIQNKGYSGRSGQDASNVPLASSASPGGVEGEGEATPPVQTKDTAAAAAAAAAATDSSAAVAMEVDANDATGGSLVGNDSGSEEKKEDDETSSKEKAKAEEQAEEAGEIKEAGETKGAGTEEKEVGETKEAGTEDKEAAAAKEKAAKATATTTAQKWAGLCLEGLKGSARWPIRREPLMSAEFLAENGVLPKVYVATKPSARLMGNIRLLEKRLGYTFRYPWLCMQAITHPSWTMFDRNWKNTEAAKKATTGADRMLERARAAAQRVSSNDIPPGTVPAQDYQRLEFLGDAVLGWMVTAHLYFASSAFTPAELTRIKSSCVCNASLWVIALRLDVHHVLRASPKILGHIHAFIENNGVSGTGTAPKHPADVLEALIGAVFIDSSCCMNTVSRVFWPLIAQYLQDYPPPAEEELEGNPTPAADGAAGPAATADAADVTRQESVPGDASPQVVAGGDGSGGAAGAAGGIDAAGAGDDVAVAGDDAAADSAAAGTGTDVAVAVAGAGAGAGTGDDGADADAAAAAAAATPPELVAGDTLAPPLAAAAGNVSGDGSVERELAASRSTTEDANEDENMGGYGVSGDDDFAGDGFVCESCEAADARDGDGGGVAPMAVEGAQADAENRP